MSCAPLWHRGVLAGFDTVVDVSSTIFDMTTTHDGPSPLGWSFAASGEDVSGDVVQSVLLTLAEWYPAIFGALFGALFASFFVVVYERVPAGRGLNGRSTCVCGRQLRTFENLPIVGWAATAGRARCCGARIPIFYVGAEIAAAFATGWAGASAGAVGITTTIVMMGSAAWVAALWRRSARRTSIDRSGEGYEPDATNGAALGDDRGAFTTTEDHDGAERKGG